MLDFIRYMLITTIRMGSPISITAAGACFSQRTGVNNIGLDGIMAMGAFLAVVGSYITGNPWIGVLFSVIAGALISVIHGFVTITCGGNMAVSSQAIILLSTGVISIGLLAVFGTIGYSDNVVALTKTSIFEKIPFVGTILSSYSPLIYLSFIILLLLSFIINKTPFGLHLCSCGEYPRAADTAGLKVNHLRYFGVIVSGVLGGIGGATLSIGSMNIYQDGMISGRGFLAIGAVVLGRHSIMGSYVAGMIFGFFEALQLYVQTIPDSAVPSQFVQMIPYITSLIILALGVNKEGSSSAPAALGESYSVIAGTK